MPDVAEHACDATAVLVAEFVECVAQARIFGYKKLTLWTNDILATARHIYTEHGFKLVKEHRHKSFGKDLVGQYWELDLEEACLADRRRSA